ncbi:MAG: hypothetical protein GEV10_31985 [Streptosporangiales bacterium]|nr:hypothetical protein [Streptosporangiales bacterium]
MIRFLCKNPDSKVENCPAVFVDDETGDLLIQGWIETDPATLATAAEHSPLAENEMIVRLPASMRELILEKLGAEAVR